MSVSGITYIQDNGNYYKVDSNGKKEQVDKAEYDRGVFATQKAAPTQAVQPNQSTMKPANSNIMGLQEQQGNPDAGAGAGATATTSEKTTVTLPNDNPQFIAQLQQQGLIKPGADGKYEVAPEMMDKLLKALGDYYSTPENMNEIEFSQDSDAGLKAKIQQQLEEAGVVDKDGKIINPGKFAQLAKNGITVDGQVFKFSSEDDGTVDVPVTTTVTTSAASKFKEMDPAFLKGIQKQSGDWKAQLKEMQKQGSVVIIDGRYYTNQANLQKKGAADITGAKVEVDPTALVGQTDAAKAARDAREQKLQEEFMLAYDTNPDNAQDTLMHTKYYKEYTKLEDALRKINKEDVSDPKKKDYGNEVAYRPKSTLARAYYAEARTIDGKVVHEYAKPDEVAALQDKINTNLKNLTQQQKELLAKNPDDRTLIDQYKKYFGDVMDDNISQLSEKQLKDLAEAQAYETGLTDVQIKHMASTQFKNRFNTQMSNVYHEYEAKIEEANQKGKTKKAAKLAEERDEKLREISNKKIETENQDRADYAARMARGQLNSEIGEGNFKKTQPTYESIIASCPKAAEFIEANKQLFYKDGQFDTQAWKDFWLSKSSTRVDNNKDSHEHIQDYFMTLGEAQDIVRGNLNGTEKEGYMGLKHLYGKNMSENEMINLARDMAETAGIVTEKNNTAGIRAAHVLGEVGKGVAGAAAVDLLGNFVLSKLHVKYGGTVPFARSGSIQGLDKFVSEFYDNGVKVGEQITERVKEHPWSVEGEEPFSGEKGVGNFHLDPLALGIGAVAGGIKGLVEMGKKHDKQDGKSEVQMYSRRDYNERTTTKTEEVQGTQQVAAKKYVANVSQKTEPVNEPIKNVQQKVTVRRGRGTVLYRGQRVAFNEAEDKKHLVASMYNLSGDELEAVFKYLITDFNKLPASYMKGHIMPQGNILNFPSKIPAGTIPGIDHDIDTSGFDPAKYQKKWIKIPLGGSGIKTQKAGQGNLSISRPGVDANASMTARRKRP